MTFTPEQLKVLSEAEQHFQTAINHNYIKSAPIWLTKQIKDIYETATGKRFSANMHCTPCVLRIYKTVGNVYFEDLIEKQQQEQTDKLSQIEVVAEDTPKKQSKKNGKKNTSKE